MTAAVSKLTTLSEAASAIEAKPARHGGNLSFSSGGAAPVLHISAHLSTAFLEKTSCQVFSPGL